MDLVTKYRNKEDDRLVTVELTEKGRLLKEDILDVPEKMYNMFNRDNLDLISLKIQLDNLLKMLD